MNAKKVLSDTNKIVYKNYEKHRGLPCGKGAAPPKSKFKYQDIEIKRGDLKSPQD